VGGCPFDTKGVPAVSRRNRRKRKRKHGEVEDSFARSIRRRTASLFPNVEKVATSGFLGLSKLSEHLIDIATCFVPEDAPVEEIEAALELAVIAWNLSLFSEQDREALLSKTLASLPTEDVFEKAEFRRTMDAMVEAKNSLYPDDERLISDYRISARGEGLDLQVASLIPGA
jgi:hypothetical protein